MILLAATVSAIFLFTSSPDARVAADPAGYRCLAWERHVEPAACLPTQTPPCERTSSSVVVSCPVRAWTDPLYIWQAVAMDPGPGQVIYGCVQAVLPSGAVSECWGQKP